jgi:hypothetical protein
MENLRGHQQAGSDLRRLPGRGSSTTYQALRFRSAHQEMINRRRMIVPPALSVCSHIETLAQQAKVIHACHLTWRT